MYAKVRKIFEAAKKRIALNIHTLHSLQITIKLNQQSATPTQMSLK